MSGFLKRIPAISTARFTAAPSSRPAPRAAGPRVLLARPHHPGGVEDRALGAGAAVLPARLVLSLHADDAAEAGADAAAHPGVEADLGGERRARPRCGPPRASSRRGRRRRGATGPVAASRCASSGHGDAPALAEAAVLGGGHERQPQAARGGRGAAGRPRCARRRRAAPCRPRAAAPRPGSGRARCRSPPATRRASSPGGGGVKGRPSGPRHWATSPGASAHRAPRALADRLHEQGEGLPRRVHRQDREGAAQRGLGRDAGLDHHELAGRAPRARSRGGGRSAGSSAPPRASRRRAARRGWRASAR